MLEQIKAVNNPLTIIAIFAGLSEVASVFALQYVKPELQYIFIWFVMGFPTGLVLIFFLVLLFKSQVLYAPSDFKDEQNYLKVNRISQNLEKVEYQLDVAPDKILEEVSETLKISEEKQRRDLLEILENRLRSIQQNVQDAKTEVDHIALPVSSQSSTSRDKIIDLLSKSPYPLSAHEILEELRLPVSTLGANLKSLETQGKVTKIKDSKEKNYRYQLSKTKDE